MVCNIVHRIAWIHANSPPIQVCMYIYIYIYIYIHIYIYIYIICLSRTRYNEVYIMHAITFHMMIDDLTD